MYRVLPCALTNAVPRIPTDAALTVTPFAPDAAGDPLGPDVPVEPVLAHAASKRARTAPKPADKKMGRLPLMVSPSTDDPFIGSTVLRDKRIAHADILIVLSASHPCTRAPAGTMTCGVAGNPEGLGARIPYVVSFRRSAAGRTRIRRTGRGRRVHPPLSAPGVRLGHDDLGRRGGGGRRGAGDLRARLAARRRVRRPARPGSDVAARDRAQHGDRHAPVAARGSCGSGHAGLDARTGGRRRAAGARR